MCEHGLTARACIVVLVAAMLSPSLFARQASPKILTGDNQAIHDYVLTMANVSKYMDVAGKLIAATKTDAALAEEVKKIGDAKVPNLEKVLLAQQSPHVAAFLKANGITERDFVMTPLTLFSTQAAIEDQMNHKPIPDFVNPANVKFVHDHQREIDKYEKGAAPKPVSKA